MASGPAGVAWTDHAAGTLCVDRAEFSSSRCCILFDHKQHSFRKPLSSVWNRAQSRLCTLARALAASTKTRANSRNPCLKEKKNVPTFLTTTVCAIRRSGPHCVGVRGQDQLGPFQTAPGERVCPGLVRVRTRPGTTATVLCHLRPHGCARTSLMGIATTHGTASLR